MILDAGCECAGCDEDADGRYDIIGLFNIEVCAKHARELRDAEFLDEAISIQIVAYQSLMTTLARPDVNPDNVGKLLIGIVTGRKELYETVMAWVRKDRTK